jgi:DNA repair protein RadC
MKTYKSDMPEITLKYKAGNYNKTKISSSLDAYNVLMNIYDDDTLDYKETAYALFLDKANKTIGWLKISEGGTSATIVDPKIIFVTALNCNASGIILSHNHPSGRMKASEEDLRITDKIISIGKLLGVIVLDHLIVARFEYLSMCDEGLM